MVNRQTDCGRERFRFILPLTLIAMLILAGCDNMREQAKLAKPYQSSPSFGVAAREIVPEAIPVGHNTSSHLALGVVGGEFTDEFPVEITEDLLARGQDRYEIFCTPCHGFSGHGNGVISEEGFPWPASYHDPEILGKPAGYYVNVIANGKGNMLSYGSRVKPEDRWAIAAYIRALQLSQQAHLDIWPQELQDAVQISLQEN